MNRLFLPDTKPVDTSVHGFARAHGSLVELHENPLFLTATAPHPDRRTALVSGGGSGHDPLHAGFVGLGMLDAAAPGRIFASPHNRQVYEASRAVAREEGVLHIVKNYTGDRINFGIAAERLRADGVEVQRVLVDDDLATESHQTATGRRGTGAALVVEKILGAAADTGLGLEELARLGGDVVAASRSLAVAGRAQTSSSRGGEAFSLAEDELEYGVGIHGERGAATIQRPALGRITEQMTTELLDGLPDVGDGVLLLVNGLGGTTPLELYAVHELVSQELEKRRVEVGARLVGTFVPALDMSGFSLTLTSLRPGWLDRWQAPVRTPAFPCTEPRS
ncbi:dihydroxyacetone kinase subunit DhaK [Streptomyces sulphureus]|uniref:dihydroxyacetone kinase subunit DhaK n=1 Tax=Streptomyces sulphureus TaxID=47758 RepID=UPI00037F3F46|nr:dihydroxyacetone kinase subunit DhaK [Streptomyces sulphureus]